MLLAEDARRQKEEAGGSPTDAETRRAARSAEVRAFCDEVWPARDAAGLVCALFTDAGPAGPGRPRRPGRRRAGAAALGRAAPVGPHRALDRRPTPCSSTRSPGCSSGPPGYGHVVVDEAQDLSPDAVPRGRPPAGRRFADRAGRPRPGDQPVVRRRTGRQTLAGLGRPGHRRPPAHPRLPGAGRGARLRQPAAAAHRARACPPATAVRSRAGLAAASGRSPTLAGPLAEVVGGAGRRRPARSGSSAPTTSSARWSALLAAAGLPGGRAHRRRRARRPRVAVVPATLAKGLEFDAVVVVDPAAIVAAEPRGLHRLYVVLTRAVSTLVVLHRDDLPAQLAAVPG